MTPDGILEAAVYVHDLDAAEAFYGGVLGMERILRLDGRHAFFRCGKSVLLCFIAAATRLPPQNPDIPVPPHGAEGPSHVCFSAHGADLVHWRGRLEAAGIEFEEDFTWPGGARSIYVRDPSGNSVELAEPKLWFAEAE
ncbi:MAG: glyoxalase/bleomycin resistance/extradiol dioxygenase family protein [Rhodobacteraceae bacterium]|nr:glyoxalase/bleomycin resistance/extradiol dioxygenase family protein [Paracoccaceae bacterium]